jgi:hypothetical protein
LKDEDINSFNAEEREQDKRIEEINKIKKGVEALRNEAVPLRY